MSKLDEARSIDEHVRKGVAVTDVSSEDQLEVAWAWARGEISRKAAKKVLGLAHEFPLYALVRQAVRSRYWERAK